MLNDLPVLIDGPGMYRTRDGKLVLIHEVKENLNPDTTAFLAKGNIMKTSRVGLKVSRYDVWHVSGRWAALGECGMDIVAKSV